MKASIKGTNLTIDMMDLVESMDAEGRADVARFICARDYLFRNVIECLVTGEYNNDEYDSWWFDPKTVAELRKRILEMLPEVEREASASALQRAKEAEEARSEAWSKQWKAERDAQVAARRTEMFEALHDLEKPTTQGYESFRGSEAYWQGFMIGRSKTWQKLPPRIVEAYFDRIQEIRDFAAMMSKPAPVQS